MRAQRPLRLLNITEPALLPAQHLLWHFHGHQKRQNHRAACHAWSTACAQVCNSALTHTIHYMYAQHCGNVPVHVLRLLRAHLIANDAVRALTSSTARTGWCCESSITLALRLYVCTAKLLIKTRRRSQHGMLNKFARPRHAGCTTLATLTSPLHRLALHASAPHVTGSSRSCACTRTNNLQNLYIACGVFTILFAEVSVHSTLVSFQLLNQRAPFHNCA